MITSLTSCNFPNAIECSSMIFFWLIKQVYFINHNFVIFYFYFWSKLSFACFSLPIIIKSFLPLESLDQLCNLSMRFFFLLTLLIDIFYSELCFWNRIITVVIVSAYPELIKLQREHKVWFHLLIIFPNSWVSVTAR